MKTIIVIMIRLFDHSTSYLNMSVRRQDPTDLCRQEYKLNKLGKITLGAC